MEKREDAMDNANAIVKTWRYLKNNGWKKTSYKIYRKLFKVEKIGYDRFRKETEPDKEELARQRRTKLAKEPLFSILVPVYKTPPELLNALLQSVVDQSYRNWELCLADGGGEDDHLSDEIASLPALKSSWPTIHYKKLKENRGIAGNTNAALAMAKGDYIVLLDHDDLLAPNALFELALACQNPVAKGSSNQGSANLFPPDFIYSDEDKTDLAGRKFFDPHFKPDFNPDLLCSMNYMCHLTCVSMDLARKVGGFDPDFDGSQDYDFVFRCVEQAKHIVHIPKVLYHWRSYDQSTAGNAASKEYAFESGRRAIEAHLQRIGAKGTVKNGIDAGVYHVTYDLPYEPLVSIIIPNKDHAGDLRRCIESIYWQSYQNVEIVIVENGSTEEATHAYYKELEAGTGAVQVVTWDKPFNYSAVNNYGASFAKGEYLLLLNNDIEWIREDSLAEMLGYAMRPGTGAVGAKLFYGDDTIQHAGVIIGIGGVAGHAFQRQSKDDRTYMYRAFCTQDYSCVTAACLLMKKSIFEEIGGFEEKLAYAFNDVDLCLRIREKGYLVVYNSEAWLYHYESKSRGLEDTPEKVARFNQEMDYCRSRWRDILRDGDPYYSPNLTLEWQDFSCRSRAEIRAAKMREEDRPI